MNDDNFPSCRDTSTMTEAELDQLSTDELLKEVVEDIKRSESRASSRRGSAVKTDPAEPPIEKANPVGSSEGSRRGSTSAATKRDMSATPIDELLREATEDIIRSESRRGSRAGSLRESAVKGDSLTNTPTDELQRLATSSSLKSESRKESVGGSKTTPRNSKPPSRADTPEIGKDQGAEHPEKDGEENKAQVLDDDMPNIADAGTGEFIDDAIDKQQESERVAFQRLVDDSALLENEISKLNDKLQEVTKQRDTFYSDLERERKKNVELDVRVHELEGTLKDYQQSVKRENTTDVIDGDQEKDGNQAKLRDLQLRLKRMVKDAEEKDEQVRRLTWEKESLEGVLDRLEPQVDREKFDEAMASRGSYSDGVAASAGNDSGNVVRGETAPQSAVCSIQWKTCWLVDMYSWGGGYYVFFARSVI